MDKLNLNNLNIIDQIASYSNQEVDDFYFRIKKELECQKNLNKVLKEQQYDDNIKNIHNFISRNSNNIDYQFKELVKVSEELKTVIIENENLKSNYSEIVNSEKCKDISNKLNQIKKIKQNMLSFLEASGI